MHVLVVGAGLQGICTAYFLAKQGAQVTVLERNSDLALEASGGNGGYLQAECPEVWNVPGIVRVLFGAWRAGLSEARDRSPMVVDTRALLGLIPWGVRFLRHSRASTHLHHTALNRELAQYSLRQMADLRATISISYSHMNCGGLFIFRDAEAIQAYTPLVNHLRERGALIELQGREELLAREPSLVPIADKLHGAIFYPRDESGDPAAFCRALATHAGSQGAEFRFNTEVKSLHSTAEGVRVRTDTGEVIGDFLVIAAGVASERLARLLGVRLPIAAAKGYSLTIPFGEFNARPSHVIADMGVHAGLNPMGNSLRVAGTAQFCGLDTSISPGRIAYLLSLVSEVLPEFARVLDRSNIAPFAGLRPLSADGLPMIGATKTRGVYVNSGHGGLGWTQAAGSARALVDTLVGREPEIDLRPFSPLRSLSR